MIRQHGERVLLTRIRAQAASVELLYHVIDLLDRRPDFEVTHESVLRPDQLRVPIDRNTPLLSLSRMIQEDICILQKNGDEHELTAALLCFPASWTLSEKIDKPLTAIHTPVPSYDPAIAKRVQRLFDGVRAGHPMWRANLMTYADPTLYHPRTELDPRDGDHDGAFERSERQTILRLPESDAVVFAIHTTVTSKIKKAPVHTEASNS